MVLLCVKNQLVEDICDITFSAEVKLPPTVTRLIIEDYCREPTILNAPPIFHIRPESELGVKKFTGFHNYLKERKKIAIAKVASGDAIYILPPRDEDSSASILRLGCIRIQQRSAAVIPAAQNPPPMVSSSSSSSTTATTAPPSSSARPTGGGRSLISGLLQKAEAEQRPVVTRDQPGLRMTGSDLVPGSSRAPVKNAYAEFENYIRGLITNFYPDCKSSLENTGGMGSLTVAEASSSSSSSSAGPGDTNNEALFMEPMEKSQRYVVHDIVSSEFADKLLTASNGERGDRHVVVYRIGHPPDGVKLENHMDGTSIQSVKGAGGGTQTASRRHAQVHQQKALQVVGTEGLTLVGTVKRDRRSMEEIQQDLKRRKCGGGESGSGNTYTGSGTSAAGSQDDDGDLF